MNSTFWQWRASDALIGIMSGVILLVSMLFRSDSVIDSLLSGALVAIIIILMSPVIRRLVHRQSPEEVLESERSGQK